MIATRTLVRIEFDKPDEQEISELIVMEGDDIIKTTRKMSEAADQAAIGSFECSDSIEAANRDIAICFSP